LTTATDSEGPPPPAPTVHVVTPAVVAVFTSIASQAALISALLYFYGRVRTGEFYGYFGIDTSALGFTTTDFVMRSLNATLPPVIVCALVILAVLAIAKHLDRAVDYLQRRPRLEQVTVIVVTVVIAVCVTVLVNGIYSSRYTAYSRGYPMPIAVIGIAAAVGMGRRLLLPSIRSPHSTDRLWSMTVAAFALGGMLWMVNLYAGADGVREARDTANTLQSPTSTHFVLYSVDRLMISGTGVQPNAVNAPGSRYHFQYSGLRLLIRTPREFVLLPMEWHKGRDPVIVLPVDDSIRFDVIPR
jgi:heme/copper-type cytochrome/quinol oxidase subunit 2